MAFRFAMEDVPKINFCFRRTFLPKAWNRTKVRALWSRAESCSWIAPTDDPQATHLCFSPMKRPGDERSPNTNSALALATSSCFEPLRPRSNSSSIDRSSHLRLVLVFWRDMRCTTIKNSNLNSHYFEILKENILEFRNSKAEIPSQEHRNPSPSHNPYFFASQSSFYRRKSRDSGIFQNQKK